MLTEIGKHGKEKISVQRPPTGEPNRVLTANRVFDTKNY